MFLLFQYYLLFNIKLHRVDVLNTGIIHIYIDIMFKSSLIIYPYLSQVSTGKKIIIRFLTKTKLNESKPHPSCGHNHKSLLKIKLSKQRNIKTQKIYCIETARQLLHNLYILGASINKIDEHLQHRCESWISYNDRLLLQVKQNHHL